MKANQMILGARLLEARKAAKFTRAEVQTKVGIPHLSLSYYEKGQTGIPALRLQKLADLYGVTYEWLLTGSDSQIDSPEFQNAVALILKAGETLGEAGKLLQKGS